MSSQSLRSKDTNYPRTKNRILLVAVLYSLVVGALLPLLPENAAAIENAMSLPLVFLAVAWAVFDAKERDIRLGVVLKLTMFFLFVIGFPIYVFKSRGWLGFLTLFLTVLFCLLVGLVQLVGEYLTLVIGDRLGYWSFGLD